MPNENAERGLHADGARESSVTDGGDGMTAQTESAGADETDEAGTTGSGARPARSRDERIARGAGVLVTAAYVGFELRDGSVRDLLFWTGAVALALLLIHRDRVLAVVLAGLGAVLLVLGVVLDLAGLLVAAAIITVPAALAAARLRPWAFAVTIALGGASLAAGWHSVHDGRLYLGLQHLGDAGYVSGWYLLGRAADS